MKIRNGFVSNSSSSSFIIGIGVIKDEKAIRKLMEGADYKYDYSIKTVDELLDGGACDISIESFNGDKLSLDINEIGVDDKILIIDYCGGGEGIPYDEEYYTYDYDIDYSFFDGHNMKDIIEELNENNITGFQMSFGAGRDG